MSTHIKYYNTKLLLNEFNIQYPQFQIEKITEGIGVYFSYSIEFPNVIQNFVNDEDYNAVILCIYKSIDAAYSPQGNMSDNCFLNIMIYLEKKYIENVFGDKSDLLRLAFNSNVVFQKEWLEISKKWLVNIEINLLSTKIPNAFIRSWVYQYLYEIAQETYIMLFPIIDKDYRQDDIQKIKKIEIIVKNTPFNGIPSISKMAEGVGMSSTKFKKLFKEAFGKSTRQYILDIKAEQARVLLETNKFSISQVAEKLGFNYPSSLTRLIKNKYKKVPLKMVTKKISGKTIV